MYACMCREVNNTKLDILKIMFTFCLFSFSAVYVLISGLFSFAVCYKHGPITNKHTLNFMTWCMQVVGMVLVYYGITFPPACYVLIMFLLCWKILPLAWSLLHLIWSLLMWIRR